MSDQPMTYRDAGVDITKGNEAVERIKPLVAKTRRPEVLGGLGGFGGLFQLDVTKYRQPVLVSGTDGVGTKLRLAFMCGQHDTIGIDAVAMCVNDILVCGAEPLYFLDYIAVGKLEPAQLAEVVAGIAEGCLQSNCALIGGETAEMPGFYEAGEYDVAGFAVGIVEKEEMITGEAIAAGDVIIGLPSTGLHSNGYSLARKIAFEREGLTVDDHVDALGETLGAALLRPTKIYVPDVMPLLENQRDALVGMAHITGGGLLENVPRILPEGVHAVFEKNSWPVPKVFQWLQAAGQVPEEDAYRTFNMGLGFVLIIRAAKVEAVRALLSEHQVDHYVVGRVEAGAGPVVFR